MRHPRRFAIILATASVPALSSAGVSTCWIKRIALVDGAIRITFESEKPLEISGSPVTIGATATEPFAATYELRQGQTLQVRQTPTSVERCELEPVIGLPFSGVARNVWLLQPGTADPLVFASIVRAEAK